ncbi:MAG: HD-GYP domain-containing protein [Candidatus Krumholzibacteria bacterium]|nr:HD-GYP domain-containing protein [Candidatus Krumholzibacteria bacterium]MDH4337890.1 HD-GYP domain-containing protein [Candidatus Krumholzibacteria bacterium]MDH5270225.1 HD-GYP domain-containing protein [Candidatus Krumholzibacteria bacterium]MDH5628020.1 HD-GYP domain-containing protein [Candidatus Krumholzibacteria bacterium]
MIKDRVHFGAAGTTVGAATDDDGRSIEDRSFLRVQGESLVIHLFAAGRTLRLYDSTNRAAQRALSEIMQPMRRLLDREGRVFLRVSNDMMLINEFRLHVEPQHYQPFEFWITEMKKRGIEALEFGESVNEEQLATFLIEFFKSGEGEDVCSELESRLEAAKVGSVTLTRWVERETTLTDTPRKGADVRQESQRVYFRTVALMGNVLRTAEEKQLLQVRKAKRLTQQMVDIIQTDESMLLGLTSIKNFDAYTFAHCVNVCILSMLIADRMRMSKPDVARLGVAALLHDIGKTYVPATILNSTGNLNEREWDLMKYHTFFGVKELSRIHALREAVDPMFVAIQHHAQYNNDGYPQRPGGWNLRLFSRIVTVADYYDAMTAWRTYQKEPITADRALNFILQKAGSIFDPFVAKIFVQAMGLYPVGTIVEMEQGELGVVTRQNADTRFLHRPVVEVLRTEGGVMRREIIDLAERTPDGNYPRTIRRALHESQVDIDKRLCFLADAEKDPA